jgi:hypothetical protein
VYRAGDHLKVRRSWGYFHHGIYVSDERVIQFGGRIFDKPRATIGAVTIEQFAQGRLAQVVQHGQRNWFGVILPTAESGDRIVERAEWLLAHHPPRRYNLVGYNREHAANWCATGWYTESHQIRSVFFLRAIVGEIASLYAAYRYRIGSISRRLVLVLVGLEAFSAVTIVMYNLHIRRFWRDIGSRWRQHEAPVDDNQ